MRAIKTSVISILAIGLLAGSVVGVTAQDEVAASAQVSGHVSSGAVPQPQVDARLVVTLEAAESAAPPLGEFVLEGANYGDGEWDFTIEYASDRIVDTATHALRTRLEESVTQRLLAIGTDVESGEAATPVITNGNPVEGIEIVLVEATDDGTTGFVGGALVADTDLPDPEAEVRIVVTLADTAAADPAALIGEFVVEGTKRLRPARSFAIDYDIAGIDEAGSYAIEARMEDVATGALLASTEAPIPVITDGNPVEDIAVKLLPVTGDDTG